MAVIESPSADLAPAAPGQAQPPSTGTTPPAGGRSAAVSAMGAIIVVATGLAFVFVIALVALTALPGNQRAAVVTAAFTVLGTIVGAYFGVKTGSEGRQQAESARDAEVMKVQELASRLDPESAEAAFDTAQQRLATTRATLRGSA